ncbi:hypothetical protein BGZ72_002719 [Mortierella alpina]|nr:hypothetical protein BGZ72_002719 [Mortierella alpina]
MRYIGVDYLSRPCKRCISVGKDDSCRDVEHKKRGRPKLIDKAVALETTAWDPAGKDAAAKSAAALNKTRVKGKYTKSANYKMPKKAANALKVTAESNFAAPQSNPSSVESVGNLAGHPSSYPTQHEPEHPTTSMPYRSQPPSSQSYPSRPLSMHSEPPLQGDHPEPLYYPSSLPSSTGQVKRPQEMYSAPSASPLATLFLTMDLICARVSDESQALWGYHPHDISHKSLYSIVAEEDRRKIGELLQLIKDAVFSAASPNNPQHLSHYPFLESSSSVFYQNRPGIMSSSAPGSSEYTDVIRVCHADGGSDLFNVRMYVGGGLGTDLLRGLNIEHAYVVCIMARHTVQAAHDHTHDRVSLDEPRPQSLSSLETQYPPKHQTPSHLSSQQRFSPLGSKEQDVARKISLPPIFTGPSANTPSLSSPSAASPLSSSSSNGRYSMTLGSSASAGPLSAPPSSSYTVSLSKPASHSSSLPSFRTGPLHTARWLYDAEPFSGSGYSGHNAPSQRLPTVFADPLRSLSAPMGGFGVSKYLNRSESTPSLSNIRRHQLPLPSPLQSSQGSRMDASARTPRSLQRDLSSSSLGASFASRSPPSSMKRPLADMADSQDRNRDIDNRHQDHRQHQSTRPASMSSSSPSSLNASSRAPYQPSLKLELQTMPPDHPAIDPSSVGVCPIVHGSQRREQIQQAHMQASQVAREMEVKEKLDRRLADPNAAPCRWAKMSDQWKDCRDNGPPGHDCFSSKTTTPGTGEREHGREYEDHEQGRGRDRARVGEFSTEKGYFEARPMSSGCPRYTGEHPSGGFSSHGDERRMDEGNNNNSNSSSNGFSHPAQISGVNPFSTGPTSPSESHHRPSNSLRRTSSVGRSSFINRGSKGSVICMSGACGSICRCSGEDEETRAVKAMDAARKRMSVHSLLC